MAPQAFQPVGIAHLAQFCHLIGHHKNCTCQGWSRHPWDYAPGHEHLAEANRDRTA